MDSSATGYRRVWTEDNGDPEDDELSDLGEPGKPQNPLQALIECTPFQTCIGLVIATNATVIGLETDHPNFWMWPTMEDTFLCVFALELSLRLYAYGFPVFFSTTNSDWQWNYMDFIIVALGGTDRLCTLLFGENKDVSQTKLVGMLMRSFRLMRILRIFKIFRVLKQFYLLVAGFVDAVSSVMWVTLLCALILYICAIMLTRMLGQPDKDDELAQVKEQYFGSIATSMLTLFQFMAYPDMEKFEPLYSQSVPMTLFLVAFVIFGAFTIVSILTGVISESMSEKSRIQQEQRKEGKETARGRFIHRIKRILHSRDRQGEGMVSRAAFERSIDDILTCCPHQYYAIGRPDLEAMFDLVDYHSTGTVEIEEFLYGLVQLTTEVRPMTIMELRRVLVRGLHGTAQQISAVEARTRSMDVKLCELLATSRAMAETSEPSCASRSPDEARDAAISSPPQKRSDQKGGDEPRRHVPFLPPPPGPVDSASRFKAQTGLSISIESERSAS